MTSTSLIRTRWAAVGAAVAITLGAVGLGGLNIVSADVSSGDRPVFIPINPCRLLDTRPGAANVGPKASPLGTGETYTVTAHGSNGECTGASAIPTDALSLSLNVTAVGATEATFLTFWGDGANPGTSNLNPRPGAAPTPNSVNTPLSTSGTFNAYNEAGNVNIIADVNGYYVGHDHDDRYYTETEADARFSMLSNAVDVGGFEFSPYDGAIGWTYTVLWQHAPGAVDCVAAPVKLPASRTVSSVSIRYNSEAAADVEVFMVGTVGTAGTFGAGEFIHPISGQVSTLPSVAASTLAEVALPLEPDLVVREDYHYSVQVCTDADFGLATVVIEFA